MEHTSFFQSLYKKGKQSSIKGNCVDVLKATSKRNFNQDIRTKRETAIDSRRDISSIEISPSPVKKLSKREQFLQKFENWKIEKQKKLDEENKIKKPVFKVYTSARLPSLNSMYKKEEQKAKHEVPQSQKFNFKVPRNMKLTVASKTANPAPTRVTRSQVLKTKQFQDVFKASNVNKKLTTLDDKTHKNVRRKSVRFIEKTEEKENISVNNFEENEDDNLFNKQSAGVTPKVSKKLLSSVIESSPSAAAKQKSNASQKRALFQKKNTAFSTKVSPKSKTEDSDEDTTKIVQNIPAVEEIPESSKTRKRLKSEEGKKIVTPKTVASPSGKAEKMPLRNKTKQTASKTETDDKRKPIKHKGKRSNSNTDDINSNRGQDSAAVAVSDTLTKCPNSDSKIRRKSLRNKNLERGDAQTTETTAPKVRKSLRSASSIPEELGSDVSKSVSPSTVQSPKRKSSKSSSPMSVTAKTNVRKSLRKPDDGIAATATPNEPSTSKRNGRTSQKILPNNSLHFITPEKCDSTVNYISPFLVRSRGKENANKEWRERRDAELAKTPTSPLDANEKAATVYFRKLLSDEIEKLEKKCTIWEMFKRHSINLPDGAVDIIDTTIGQTNLLITKKFQQFRGLIDDFENGTAAKRILCEDLHGFWDMVYMQVENLNKRYENLETMKNNNWEEITPTSAAPQRKNLRIKRNPPVKQTIAKPAASGIRAHIAAMKKKKQTERRTPRKSGASMEQTLSTPNENLLSNKTPRKSILKSVLKSEARKRMSSPGLIMAKVTNSAKAVASPSRTSKRRKTVLFKDSEDLISFSSPDI